MPLKLISELLKAVIDSRSRWFVGSSIKSTLGFPIIILDSIHLTFSPPESTLHDFKASSPLKSILPRKLLMNNSSLSSSLFDHCLSQSTREIFFLKKELLSIGKYPELVVTPQLYDPDVCCKFPEIQS